MCSHLVCVIIWCVIVWCVVGWCEGEEAGGGRKEEGGGQAMKTRTHTEAVVGIEGDG